MRRMGFAGVSAIAVVLSGNGVATAAPFAWITTGNGSVMRLDLASNEAVVIPIGTGAIGVAVSRDGTRAYVGTQTASGTVAILDTASATVLATVPVAPFPEGLALTPDGTRLYVTHGFEQLVSVIDTASATVVNTIPTNGAVKGAAANASGTRVYLAKEQPLGHVLVIDTATNMAVADVLVSSTSPPWGVAVSPDGTRVYAGLGEGAVAVVDATTNLLLTTVPLACGFGCSGIPALVVSPDGTTVYASGFDDDTVSVLDVASATEVATIPIGGAPYGLDVTADGTRLYVARSFIASLEIVDTATNMVTASVPSVDGLPLAFGRFIGGPLSLGSIDADALRCQKSLSQSFPKFGAKAHKLLAKCLDKVLGDLTEGPVSQGTTDSCVTKLDPNAPTSALARARLSAGDKIVARCGGVTPLQIGLPCAPTAPDMTAVAGCVLDRQADAAGRSLAAEYRDACALLGLVGLAADFPGACTGP